MWCDKLPRQERESLGRDETPRATPNPEGVPIDVANLRECVGVTPSPAVIRDPGFLSSVSIFPPAAAATTHHSPPPPPLAPLLQGNFSSTTGLVTLGMMLLSGQVFNSYGWGTAAKATPVVLLVTGVRLNGMGARGGGWHCRWERGGEGGQEKEDNIKRRTQSGSMCFAPFRKTHGGTPFASLSHARHGWVEIIQVQRAVALSFSGERAERDPHGSLVQYTAEACVGVAVLSVFLPWGAFFAFLSW